MRSRSKSFAGVARSTFEQIKNDLHSRGVKVSEGDDCVVEYGGFRGSLTYDERDEYVAIQILAKPIFVSELTVWNLIGRAMHHYGAVEAE
jgi:hypothetical protein